MLFRKENEDPLLTVHDLQCPALSCTFSCASTENKELLDHLRSSDCLPECDNDKVVDYLCSYCPYSNVTKMPVVIHQTLEHPDLDLKVIYVCIRK